MAKLTEKGLLRSSFVPPAEIRRLRDDTRLREDVTHDLGPDFYTNRILTQRGPRNHLAHLAAMGYRVTIEPPA